MYFDGQSEQMKPYQLNSKLNIYVQASQKKRTIDKTQKKQKQTRNMKSTDTKKKGVWWTKT